MSYAVTGTLLVTWKALDLPVPTSSVLAPVAVGWGQERTTLGSSTKVTSEAPER